MKLLKRENSGFTFLIGKRERELLFGLLKRYPVMIAAHFRGRHPAQGEARQNLELLEEALAEQQRDNRRQLEQLLKEPGRFKETDLGFAFHLAEPEMEWLLQVLNDIRVGSWIQLGEPDSNSGAPAELTEKNVQLAWAMEMAGLFEHAILQAMDATA